MEPWLSWAIVLGAAAVAYWYYRPAQKSPSRPRSNTGLESGPVTKSTKKEERAKRKPSSADLKSQVGPVVSAVQDAAAAVADAVTSKKPTMSSSGDGDDSSADRHWAEQLDKARKGTNLTAPSRDANRTKTVKAATANTSSSAFSYGGAEGDDDLTPDASPTLKAGDVSDMLEPKQAGPSILRLTEPANAPPQRAPRPQKEFQVAETKKQRQNRKKNEERKAANEDTEQQRQALLEKQRRSAREARGEPAKNGLQQSRPPTKNAWADKSQQDSSKIEGHAPTLPLLDTFERAEPPAVGNAQVSVMPTNGTNGHHEYTNGMTEEEQVTLASKISEDEDGWNTVATKKGKKTQPSEGQPASKGSSGGPKVANGFATLQEDD